MVNVGNLSWISFMGYKVCLEAGQGVFGERVSLVASKGIGVSCIESHF